MDFTKPKINKEKKKRLKPRSEIYDPRSLFNANLNLAENFRNHVAETVPSAVFLHLLPDPDDNTLKIDERNNENSSLFTLDSLSPLKPLPPSIDDIKARGRAIKRKLQFTEDEIDLVEKRTKLQSDSRGWFQYRKRRLTASKCKRITSLKATTSPTKALREILSYNQVP